MNVAFLAKRYDTVGGSERNLYELTRHFAAFGHPAHVYCLEARRDPEAGVIIHRLPRLGIGRTANLWSFGVLGPRLAYRAGHDLVISFVRAVRQDIVRNGGGTHRLYLEKIAAAEGRLKRLVRAVDPYHRSLLAIERRQYQPGHYVKIVANAEVVKSDIMQTYGVPAEDIEVIYNGVDLNLFNPGQAERYRSIIRSQHEIPDDAPVIIFMGNGYKRKGLDVLLQAVARVKERGVYCLVVGADPQMPAYQERARQLGIADRVRFAGAQSRPYEYYAAADLFALPSLYEPFGHSTLEALACGLPVIGARRTGASALLTGPLSSYSLDDPQDVNALTDRIGRLLDPAVRQELRPAALAISQAYTLEANARAFETLCRKVLEEKRNRKN